MGATKPKAKGAAKKKVPAKAKPETRAKPATKGGGGGGAKGKPASVSKTKGTAAPKAASKPGGDGAAPDWMESCAAFARPAAEHALLEPFVGRWKGVVRMFMEPEGDPQESTGVMTNTLVLGGKFLEQVYEDDSGQFSGRGFWGFNTVNKRWEGFWIDSMSSFFQIEHGVYDAGAKRWDSHSTMTDPMTGQPMTKRSVIRVTGPDSHVMEMYFKTTAGEHAGVERKCMEIEYARLQ